MNTSAKVFTDNVLLADSSKIIFRKNNGQIHIFDHLSFSAMYVALQHGNWKDVLSSNIGQILKALYWIPEEMRKDHNGFGQLISCLEVATFVTE